MAGVVVGIKDLIVQIQFDDDFPALNELVVVENGHDTQLLVDRLDPNGIVYGLNVRGDLRMAKGMPVQRLHKSIEVPVGDPSVGRILNALGDPLDGLEPVAGEGVAQKDI